MPKMVRTFHPVGHGAFYTERFYDDNGENTANVIFDCGCFEAGKAGISPKVFEQRIKTTIQKEFCKDTKIDIGLLQVPHHGSEHNINNKLYYPARLCIISAGVTDKYGHPDQQTLVAIQNQRGIPIIVTEDPKTKQVFTYNILRCLSRDMLI